MLSGGRGQLIATLKESYKITRGIGCYRQKLLAFPFGKHAVLQVAEKERIAGKVSCFLNEIQEIRKLTYEVGIFLYFAFATSRLKARRVFGFSIASKKVRTPQSSGGVLPCSSSDLAIFLFRPIPFVIL